MKNIDEELRFTAEELRSLCIKNHWFGSGSNEQYVKFFQANENGATLSQLALIIWICSSLVSRTEILQKLTEERNEKIARLL